jgi:hypothetical protein
MSHLSASLRENAIGLVRLDEQHIERRDVRVPLDERRNRAEAIERLSVKPPNGW